MGKLKSFIFSAILIIALTFSTFGQTNNSVRFSESGTNTLVIEWEFTLDSLAGLMSQQFTLNNFDGVDLNTYPITFKRNTVSTYATPYMEIFLLGCYQSRTDTTALDTIAYRNTGEVDSTGTLTLNLKRAASYRFLARCLNADINSGKVTMVIPRKEQE